MIRYRSSFYGYTYWSTVAATGGIQMVIRGPRTEEPTWTKGTLMGHIEAMRIPEDKKKVKAFRISEALANLHDEKSGDRQPKSIPVIDSADSSSSLLIKTNNNQDAPIGGDQTMASTSASTSVNPRLRPKPKPSSNIVRFDSNVVTPLIPSSSLQQPIMVGNSLRSSAFK